MEPTYHNTYQGQKASGKPGRPLNRTQILNGIIAERVFRI